MTVLKVVAVGDGCVGKTSLLITYATNTFPHEYVPTVYDHASMRVMVGGIPVEIVFFDTAGGEDYHRLRPLSYPMTDLFLLCFSIENPDSLENIESSWVPELRHFCPGVPIVLVACKLDLRCAWTGPTLSYDEGYAVAKRNGLCYSETSALTQFGVKECFDNALRSALCAPKVKENTVYKRTVAKLGSCDSVRRAIAYLPKEMLRLKKVVPGPPLMPISGTTPKIEIEPSSFGEDWYQMLQDPKHCDVTFILEGKHRLDAHTLVLCSASETFAKIFGICTAVKNDQMRQVNAIDNYTSDQLNSGGVPGIAALYHSDAKGQGHRIVPHTTVELSADIPAKTFVRVLEFLYAGVPKFPDSDDVSEEALNDLERVSAIFNLPQLQNICTNIMRAEKFLNPSIEMFMNEEMGTRMKELFFNQPDRADVVFNVDGTKVYAHKCVLTARCDVMAAMFSGNFAESRSDKTEIHIPNTTVESLLAVLEYLYTDHSPIEDSDSVGIMVLSDQYDLKRLMNLCELYITKEVDRKVTKQIETSEIDVIGLLHTSQTYNSSQLANWCLFFVASNYTAFENRPEFPQLKGDNKTYVEENRWPPLSYLEEVEQYNKKYGNKTDKKCVEKTKEKCSEKTKDKCGIM